MKIIPKKPEVYGLQKVSKNCHRIVKVLREYEKEQDAVKDLTRLLTGEITENDLANEK